MQSPRIPRLELETFAKESFKIPFLNVEQFPVSAAYFTIKNRENHPVQDYISPNRREFYKIFHITSGTGILTVGLHRYEMTPNDIAFLHPDEIMSWQNTSTDTGGHFCLIHPHYFNEAPHLVHLFRSYPFFQADKAVVQLTPEQSAVIHEHFRLMLDEEEGKNEDKKQAILLHLQMILLHAQRAGNTRKDTGVPDTYRHIHGFLALLESTFQVKSIETVISMKTASKFAQKLNVHPNYLNALVKAQTGKTVREHIQERLLHEAKLLLTRTDWDINNISYALGFSEQAAFTSFFSRKTNFSPSRFRARAIQPSHL